ncbi:pentapeptide repeat-containing protein [Calothrix sp. NIES-2098]|uniref:pentapeptide repeat-containing protein n=1 Tax=Calothrix sp. NIES-2098 TaxID=1954171 RepID=UPI000B6027E7|nr:pentapeptide repeat-containing protein [Calothrix sp. NIES-2098]
MAAWQNTSFLNFLPKNNNPDKQKKTSPSAKKSRIQIRNTLLTTLFVLFGLAIVENTLKDETPPATIQPKFNTKNRQIIEFIEAYNQNEKRKEEEKKCKYKIALLTWILCPLADSKLLGQVQNIGVISAAILFFWDTFDRKKQLERQAWQLIDGAQGSETSGARKQAIEDLHQEKSDITGLDADGADLRGINLSGANLERSSFKNAILEGANFEGAILRDANFTGAKLKGANFNGADLWGAVLIGADLCRARLEGTNLSNANLDSVDLCDAKFGQYEDKKTKEIKHTILTSARLIRANIENINLAEVEMSHACFGGARTGRNKLDIMILRQANNSYKKALYDQDFCKTYPEEQLEIDKLYEEKENNKNHKNEKIQKIKNRISTSLQDQNNSSELLILLDALIEILSEPEQESNIKSESQDLRNEAIAIKSKLEKVEYNSEQILPSAIAKKNELDQLVQDTLDKQRIIDEKARILEEKLKPSQSDEKTDEQ